MAGRGKLAIRPDYAGQLAGQCRMAGMEVQFEREYRFHATRRWRLDLADPALFFAVEVEGLTVQGGRHQRIGGFKGDLEKYAEAAVLGWRVLRVSTEMVRNGRALGYVELMLRLLKWEARLR